MKYLIGNWKANKTINEAQSWIEAVKKESPATSDQLTVVLCPSFIHLVLFKNEYPGLILGSQDLSPYADGAYTGQITARMLSGLVEYAILGHSERRRYFEETTTRTAQKAREALDNNITPIVAVDQDNWRRQKNELGEKMTAKSILMYEPPEAISRQIGPIGKGDAASIDEVKEMLTKIKEESAAVSVIYGGSVKSQNIANFLEEPVIDGVLPGSASLNAQEWVKMIKIANQSLSEAPEEK
jgi:triosephosphate isomerase (TIM)